jgi:hypothetical protein
VSDLCTCTATSAHQLVELARAAGTECHRCGCVGPGVRLESSCTAYHYEGPIGGPDDPNKDIPLCRAFAEAHYEFWDACGPRSGRWATRRTNP